MCVTEGGPGISSRICMALGGLGGAKSQKRPRRSVIQEKKWSLYTLYAIHDPFLICVHAFTPSGTTVSGGDIKQWRSPHQKESLKPSWSRLKPWSVKNATYVLPSTSFSPPYPSPQLQL